MRANWDTYFMNLATTASERSTCLKRRVGVILVDHTNHIISTGYNGSEPGKPHCEEVGCLLDEDGKCKRTIHAEDNALRRSNRWRRRHSKLYSTDFPCLNCAKKIVKAGVAEVVYEKLPRKPKKDVLALLEEEGIVIRQYSPVIQ